MSKATRRRYTAEFKAEAVALVQDQGYKIADGSIREWQTPGGPTSAPYAIAVDGQDRVWFSEVGRTPNRLIAFDPESETFLEPIELGSGGGIIRHMTYHAPTETMWFGADTGTIGRIQVHP